MEQFKQNVDFVQSIVSVTVSRARCSCRMFSLWPSLLHVYSFSIGLAKKKNSNWPRLRIEKRGRKNGCSQVFHPALIRDFTLARVNSLVKIQINPKVHYPMISISISPLLCKIGQYTTKNHSASIGSFAEINKI